MNRAVVSTIELLICKFGKLINNQITHVSDNLQDYLNLFVFILH